MTPSGALIGDTHTYTDLHMIPKHKLIIAPPLPKIITFDIPGRDGVIDVTDAITGRIPFSNAKGSWEFLVLSGYYYQDVYSDCMVALDGSRKALVLDDDPYTTYYGRFWINTWKSLEGFSNVTVDYDIEPF